MIREEKFPSLEALPISPPLFLGYVSYSIIDSVKIELKRVLDIQRNLENKFDCALQCYGIASFVQKGIIPTGPIPTGSFEVESHTSIVYNFKKLRLEERPTGFEKFKALLSPDRTLTYSSISYRSLDKYLHRQASQEETGFVHGMLHFYKNNFTIGHILYFFATEKEILYVENQWHDQMIGSTYPFFNTFPKHLQLHDYDPNYFNTTINAITVDNWFFPWGIKIHINALQPFLYKPFLFFKIDSILEQIKTTASSHEQTGMISENKKNQNRKRKHLDNDTAKRAPKPSNRNSIFITQSQIPQSTPNLPDAALDLLRSNSI